MKSNSQTLENQNLSQNESEIQEKNVNVKVLYGTEMLQLQVGQNWSINKLKCLLVYLFPTLKFDQFQMLSGNYLLTSNSMVKDISSDYITITKADCKGSFEEYYSYNMNKIFSQYNINCSKTTFSTLHPCFVHPLRRINNYRMQNIQPVERGNVQQRQQNNQGLGLLGVLRIFGCILMFQIISSLADYFQIFVIILVGLLYFLIDHHVGQNNRRRVQRNNLQRQNQNRPQQQKVQNKNNEEIQEQYNNTQQQHQNIDKQKQFQSLKSSSTESFVNQINEQKKQDNLREQKSMNQIKIQSTSIKKKNTKKKSYFGRIVLFIAFLTQIVYCYILSLFPNWTVQTHILANQQRMNSVIQYVQKLDGKGQLKNKKFQ